MVEIHERRIDRCDSGTHGCRRQADCGETSASTTPGIQSSNRTRRVTPSISGLATRGLPCFRCRSAATWTSTSPARSLGDAT
jgi:hypothetical protein